MSEHGDDMIELHPDALHVHLTVEDARTAQLAGARFARTLAGADPQDFALALADQEHLIRHAIVDAGHSADRATHAAGHFGVAARDEWVRIANASPAEAWGTA